MDLQYGWVGGWKLCKQTVDPTHWRICSLPPSVWCQRPRSQFVTGMKEVCESSRLSFSPRKTRPGERPSGSCLVTCSSILFIYFLPSSIDLRLSLTHCHRAADHHLTFFSSQIYTKYWIFPPYGVMTTAYKTWYSPASPPPPSPWPFRFWRMKYGFALSVIHNAPASNTSSGVTHMLLCLLFLLLLFIILWGHRTPGTADGDRQTGLTGTCDCV